jgi:hypothetical protein
MAEPQRCQDILEVRELPGQQRPIGIRCQRLIVTAKGTKVEHTHHRRDLDIAGCEQARVTWTRRR